MLHSSRALGLPLDPSQLPDDDAVSALKAVASPEDDAVMRIVLTGGTDAAGDSTCWMRCGPLTPTNRPDGLTIGVGIFRVSDADPLARHKTLNYWARRNLEYERALAAGVG